MKVTTFELISHLISIYVIFSLLLTAFLRLLLKRNTAETKAFLIIVKFMRCSLFFCSQTKCALSFMVQLYAISEIMFHFKCDSHFHSPSIKIYCLIPVTFLAINIFLTKKRQYNNKIREMRLKLKRNV